MIFRSDMTAKQYKAAREWIGLTQRELATQCGVTTKTISERERGLVKIGKEAEMVILLLKSKNKSLIKQGAGDFY